MRHIFSFVMLIAKQGVMLVGLPVIIGVVIHILIGLLAWDMNNPVIYSITTGVTLLVTCTLYWILVLWFAKRRSIRTNSMNPIAVYMDYIKKECEQIHVSISPQTIVGISALVSLSLVFSAFYIVIVFWPYDLRR